MWAYPQMYYFESEQIFNLFKPKKSRSISKGPKSRKTYERFSYEFNNRNTLIQLPQEDTSLIEQGFELGGAQLGRVMVTTGLTLLVPEGTEVVAPITLADEVLVFTLFVGVIILKILYSEKTPTFYPLLEAYVSLLREFMKN